MGKTEFLEQLRRGLSGCPEQEKEERIAFYDEMISDYLEEGLTESEAVAKIGDPRDIAAGIMADLPLAALVKERIKPGRKLKGWEIALIILGSPVWLALAISAIAVIFSVYVALWSVVVAVYAADLAFAVTAICAPVYGLFTLSASGMMMIGIGVFSAGAAIALFVGCIKFTGVMVKLTRTILRSIKSLFIRKDESVEEDWD